MGPSFVDLLILKALTFEPRHGYAVSEWVGAATHGALLVEEGTLYQAPHRPRAMGSSSRSGGSVTTTGVAKFYRLAPKGRRHLEVESKVWSRYSEAVARALGTASANP